MSEDDDRWRAWKEQTFGNDYMIWHDGLYTAQVTSLSGDAREAALGMLRLGPALGDSHAAEALAAMGDPSTIGPMRAQLDDAQGTEKVRVALAIHELGPDPRLAPHLVEVLRGTSRATLASNETSRHRHALHALQDPDLWRTAQRGRRLLVGPQLVGRRGLGGLRCGGVRSDGTRSRARTSGVPFSS